MEVRNADFPPAGGVTDEFWARFVRLSERAGRFMLLFTEVSPYLEAYRKTGEIPPELREKADMAIRGMDHFMPFIDKYVAFMRMVDETPLELVDPAVLEFLDTLQ